METRKAEESDIEEIIRIRDHAIQTMRNDGNYKQWTGGYPGEKLLLSDISQGKLYVMEKEGKVHAFFFLSVGTEPSYSNFPSPYEYAVIHRIASDGVIRNVLGKAVKFASGFSDHIRIDTHEDNKRMQHLIGKCGFSYLGIIYLVEDGTPRLCYEKTIGDTPASPKHNYSSTLVNSSAPTPQRGHTKSSGSSSPS